ncbi:MAG: LysR family transcriptional regulator [Dehalococcoidia bacterium]|nr:LysR family transcriptional regulator [Dehalococcoidia bacterium]
MDYEYPRLSQLAYLREVERSGSLTAAAERLGVSQPALSQSLSDLERRLGVALFERAGRRRVLTEAGREAVVAASEVFERLDMLRDDLQARARGEVGSLRVGMIDAASLYLLPNAIRAFRERYPEVDLHLIVESSEVLLRQLRAFDVDVAFVVGPLADDLVGVPVLEEPLFIYRPASDSRGGGAEGSEGATGSDWALYPSGSRTRQLIDEALARMGVRPRARFESANPDILRQAIALGLAWGVLPEAVAVEAGDALVRVGGTPLATRSLVAARRRTASSDSRIDALLALATGD